jgi:2-dehydro-3-deoxy-D-pentonate aldolase
MPIESASSQTPLAGIVPPLVTPLLDYDTLDVEGTERLIEHVIAGGVSGVFILGTTGEAPSLSYRLRHEFIQLACRLVDQRVPVMVGITDTSFVESIAVAQTAQEAGAYAAVLSTPYYFPAGQTELIQYVKRILPNLPLPLMLYNMPSLTKVWFEHETLQQLTEFDQIIGMKDSSGDWDYFLQLPRLKQTRPDWSILLGPEHFLVDAIAIGADGGVNGGANIFPELFVQCYEAARADDAERARQLLEQIETLQQIYSVGKYASRYIKATKSALSIRGICSDKLAEPFNHFMQPERDAVSNILDRIIPELETLLQ